MSDNTMKKLMVILLFILVTLSALAVDNAVDKAHRTTHRINVVNIDDKEEVGLCSATAIGPHMLLTAAHCMEATNDFSVDDVRAIITLIIGDGLDHIILILDGIEFKDYADLSDDTLKQGDEIFIFGNPGGIEDVFRKGYVSTETRNLHTLYDLNGFMGDSGAAVFNKDGDVSGVISFVSAVGKAPYSIKLVGSYPILFSSKFVKQLRYK